MIIVKTKDGDCFINDKEILRTKHDRKSKKLYTDNKNGSSHIIFNVESVIFVSDAEKYTYTDEGSELSKFKKKCSEMREYLMQQDKFLSELQDDMLQKYGNLGRMTLHSPGIEPDLRKRMNDELEKLHSLIFKLSCNETRESSH